MSSSSPPASKKTPPDMKQRLEALDTRASFLVRAPAGSGKTHLLTTRFLRLLAEVDDPRAVVAITFTRAAAAEMRLRIVQELEAASAMPDISAAEQDPLRHAAQMALQHIRAQHWTVLEYPDQLRIQTIDSFCHSIAMRAPLQWGALSALGGRMDAAKDFKPLYRKAARRTLAMLESGRDRLQAALRSLLQLRDAQWLGVEDLLCEMLADRGRWFRDFVFDASADEQSLRAKLEAPMRTAALATFHRIYEAFCSSSELSEELLRLFHFAAQNVPGKSMDGGRFAEFPSAKGDPIRDEALRASLGFYREMAGFLLTGQWEWRKKTGLTIRQGFPATDEGRAAKEAFAAVVARAQTIPGLRQALRRVCESCATGYTDAEWRIVQDAFVVLRYAAAQLQLVFAESGTVDYTEVASVALRMLHTNDGLPSEFALDFAAGIRHLLMDEFQDTSRKQYELIDHIVAAWPGGDGRTCFCVGDPMQSIYGFRESDYELFDRPALRGFGADHDGFADPNRILLQPIQLTANFRSAPALVAELNERLPCLFASSDAAAPQVPFVPAEAVREQAQHAVGASVALHLSLREDTSHDEDGATEEKPRSAPEWIPLVRAQWELASAAEKRYESEGAGEKYRIAILGRNRKTLFAAAEALEAAGIPFSADEMVPFDHRMEVLDAISLAQAALNPEDRLAWLSVLRAPWCALTLDELHLLVSADDPRLKVSPVPVLVKERIHLLSDSAGESRTEALLRCTESIVEAGRQRQLADTEKLGRWLHRLWRCVGGELATSEQQKRNLQLLWKALDQLPRGELDLVECDPEVGWRAALGKIQPVPDATHNSDFGVRLMTIHKAKGLEFEVVILPEMHRRQRASSSELLTWLERGVSSAADLTEFLIAPIQAKGAERGDALAWVKEVKQAREAAEERRVFYVAATRAREQLHLFAEVGSSEMEAADAGKEARAQTLFQVVRPAFAPEILRFAQETQATAQDGAESKPVANLEEPRQVAHSRRVLQFTVSPGVVLPAYSATAQQLSLAAEGQAPLFERPSGGLRTRAEGIAVHLLLQYYARLRQTLAEEMAQQKMAAFAAPLAAQLGEYGMAAAEAQTIADWACAVVARCASEPLGAWILSPHARDFAEISWTGKLDDEQGNAGWRTVRPDRCFLAGESPASSSDAKVWWIIDYKTTGHAIAALQDKDRAQAVEDFLVDRRGHFAPQLNSYAQILMELRRQAGEMLPAIRLGVYYPLLGRLDHWSYSEVGSRGK